MCLTSKAEKRVSYELRSMTWEKKTPEKNPHIKSRRQLMFSAWSGQIFDSLFINNAVTVIFVLCGIETKS